MVGDADADADAMESVFSSWQEITLMRAHIQQQSDLLTYSEKDVWLRGNDRTLMNCVVA